MDRFLRRFPLVVLALALGATSAWAQATASISGTARDQSGAVLPGSHHRYANGDRTRPDHRHQRNRFLRTSNLPLGPYRVEAALQGVPHVRANWCRPASQQQPRD